MKTDLLDIRNCDCMDMMREYPDNHFELAIVDPPYGIGESVSMGRRSGQAASHYHKFHGDDKHAPDEFYFDELFRISQRRVIWGANHFIDRIAINSPCWIMWDKGFSEDVTFAQFELAWTNLPGTCKKFDKSPIEQHRIHPTQKPVALYKWLLQNYAKEGDKILDTHMGSGSIAIACHYMGFNLTASELDEDYFNSACERIKRETAQTELELF